VNIEVKHKPNHTPLNVAKFRGHALVVELLLEHGADVDIEHGADVDIEHDFGASVFEDEISKEVNRDAAVKTKNILLK
ncbi:unnamed protein product, partial [Rotaria magnacalcarata]